MALVIQLSKRAAVPACRTTLDYQIKRLAVATVLLLCGICKLLTCGKCMANIYLSCKQKASQDRGNNLLTLLLIADIGFKMCSKHEWDLNLLTQARRWRCKTLHRPVHTLQSAFSIFKSWLVNESKSQFFRLLSSLTWYVTASVDAAPRSSVNFQGGLVWHLLTCRQVNDFPLLCEHGQIRTYLCQPGTLL